MKSLTNRRHFLTGLAAGSALAVSGIGRGNSSTRLPVLPLSTSPSDLARNEAFWSEFAGYYDRTQGVVNLEHGYWGKMARPVLTDYIEATRMVNAQNSFYARKAFASDSAESTRRIAAALGANPDEIVITRNATEAIDNLIRQYREIGSGDSVLLADIDYPQFKKTMRWLETSRGVEVVELELPPMASQNQLLELYRQTFDSNPRLKLMLLTHVSNQHGLVLPVAKISALARQNGIDVICDSAQSWGLLDYQVADLGVDWVGFNLHKWIGAPVGVGALYMKRGSLSKIAPYPGQSDPDDSRMETRVHTATSNFAAILAIPSALDFHHALGPANKEARLRYLRSLWTDAARQMNHIEILGGADEESWTGIGSFRLRGQTSIDDLVALQQRMELEFGIFTVIRKGLASGCCLRITPQVFTSSREINHLIAAMEALG